MNFFGIHFCMDEFNMIVMSIPFIGPIIAGVRSYAKHVWCRLNQHRSHK